MKTRKITAWVAIIFVAVLVVIIALFAVFTDNRSNSGVGSEEVTTSVISVSDVIEESPGEIEASDVEPEPVGEIGVSDVESEATEEIKVPDIVLETAEQYVAQRYADSLEEDGFYSDWRIESLVHEYTYDDLVGMTLQVYRMNFEFLASDPEKVLLVGGRSIDEDGWVVYEYPNSTYLIYQQDGGSLSYLGVLFENDCHPGDEIFTNDLKLRLGLIEFEEN